MGIFSVHTRLLPVAIILCLSLDFRSAIDTITSSQFIKDPETLSSSGSLFTLGFFSPENSTHRYVGIWYMSESSIVWVANRNQPLKDSASIVTISEDGNLVVQNGQKQIIWSSNVSAISSNTTCRLLDSGNLVLLENKGGNIIWKSFEHPSDTYLPNMKISSNKITGKKVKYISWRSPSDPSLGNFYMCLERQDLYELFIWNGTRPYWRSGPWNGRTFTGMPLMSSKYNNGANIVSDMDGNVYYIFNEPNGSDFKGFSILNSQGKSLYKHWDGAKKVWQESNLVQQSDCDIYGICGPFGSCNSESSPICNCLRGFEPSSRDDWNSQNWDGGCIRRTALQCERVNNGTTDGNKDGFFHLQNIKLPDFGEWSSALEDACKSQCLENCSCVAYSYDTEIGCISWGGNLTDIQQFSSGGNDLYIRLAYTELGKEYNANNNTKRVMIVIIIVIALTGTIVIATCTYFLLKWKARHSEKTSDRILGELSEVRLQELLAYDFGKVAMATNNFHLSNKLGQGGFGPVYKGKLQDGQEIAVKRLSRASGQGVEEFINEVIVISKLQHHNLVRLLGCCIEGEEKMLIYEYMPNKSLDAFIFDEEKHKLLGWGMRFGIIEGVARGLLYLHRDSRLKIIHRDLKASNILLDENLNPKISDFGMARIFGGSQDQANTRRVVGTYGYMSPKYAMEGLFSEKSDVFSFGVFMLEIIAGRRNSSFYNGENSLSLLGFAWKSWNEENIVPLIDPNIYDPHQRKDILRCIHIGLLCVQDIARERPSMSTIISMLNSEVVNLPSPRQPAFIQWQSIFSSMPHEERHGLFSNNNVSITDITGR